MPFMISVASYKGGVGKTTTAVHLAYFFHSRGKTILLDADANRASVAWAEAGSLPFTVVPYKQGLKQVPHFNFVIVDTEARPEKNEMKDLAAGCDLLVVPCSPDAMSLRVLEQTVEVLQASKANYRVLLTIIPPRPTRDGDEAREYLRAKGIPLFDSGIKRLMAFQRAPLDGVTVDRLDRDNTGWQCYERVGEEIVKLHLLE